MGAVEEGWRRQLVVVEGGGGDFGGGGGGGGAGNREVKNEDRKKGERLRSRLDALPRVTLGRSGHYREPIIDPR